jgi:1-acyl-sn-glycerol-3-phosphate acyltransferase
MLEAFSTLVASIRSIAAYVSVSLWVLLFGPPGILISILFNRPEVLYCLGRGGVRLGLGLVGITYRTTGQEYIQRDRSAVYCVNHSSNIEPPILYMVLSILHPKLKVLYKSEIHRIPVLSKGFDIVGFVPIKRNNRSESIRAIDKAAASLRDGNSFLIFPEGTRSKTGELQPFKKGGFIMAIKGKSAIVPMAIQGTRTAMRKGSLIIKPITVSVRIGPPIEVDGVGIEQRDALIKQGRTAVEALLG